jgi:hypothetical protein
MLPLNFRVSFSEIEKRSIGRKTFLIRKRLSTWQALRREPHWHPSRKDATKVDDMSRQLTAPAAKLSALMNKPNQTISSSGGNRASGEHNGNRVLQLGLDVHYRQVTVAMQEDGGRIKGAGKVSHQAFGHWMDKKLVEGWPIESCYEAGASGYWLNRQLAALGVKNLVVASKAMGQGGKRQKTDRRDSAELVDCVDRNLRGQDKALSVVAVPSVEGEEKRALIRYGSVSFSVCGSIFGFAV